MAACREHLHKKHDQNALFQACLTWRMCRVFDIPMRHLGARYAQLASPIHRTMKTLTEQLAQYAAYHRDQRNIATHFVGIPMIVLATTALLSRPVWMVGDLAVSPAWFAAVAASLFYLALDRPLGLLMSALMALSVAFGAWAAAQSTPVWLLVGVGGFALGWIIQFVGHVFEGRKPAFVDDLIGLLVGPLFVVAEALFLLGLLPALAAEIERRSGAMRRV